MREYKTFVISRLEQYKCKAPFDILRCLPVYNESGKIAAYLRPITADYRETIPNCAELLANWRRENPSLVRSYFQITTEGTRRWLDREIIGNDGRILFLLVSLENEPLGHMGFACFDYIKKSAEIDLILRGVKEGVAGLMTFGIRTLVWWGQAVLKLEEILLKTYEDNARAIRLYERCGFKPVGVRALAKKGAGASFSWEAAPDVLPQDAERREVIMRLENAKPL